MTDIELVVPLDYLILDLLPNEGAMALGVYPEGAMASEVRKKVASGKLTINQVSTRLRVLRLTGYTTLVRGLGKDVWQRTPEGQEALEKWRKQNDSGS